MKKQPEPSGRTPADSGQVHDGKTDVPLDALAKCWHIYPEPINAIMWPTRSPKCSAAADHQIVPVAGERQKLFSNIECYHLGSTDAGLLTIEGKLVKGVKMEDAEAAVQEELENCNRKGLASVSSTK